MVLAILALRPELPPVTDELRKRVQSIRVRSAQDSQSSQHSQGWRQKASPGSKFQQNTFAPKSQLQARPQGLGGHWRQNAPAIPITSSPGQGSPMPPFRFSNSSPNQTMASVLSQAHTQAQTHAQAQPHAQAQSQPHAQAQTQTHTQTHTQAQAQPHTQAPMRYTSKFHNGSKKGDDQILNTVILNKLNLFSVKTYDDVKQFLFQILGSDQREFVREFTWLVFRKAAAEEKFCGLFAKLLSEIKKEYPVILEEMRNLHTTYLDIWNIKDAEDTKVDRRCRLGYSQFLAELTALEVLESDTMKATLETLKACIVECLSSEEYKETIEEYMDCLRQLCGSRVPKPVKQMIKDLLVGDMESWISKEPADVPGLSQKSRFACMDLRDLLCK